MCVHLSVCLQEAKKHLKGVWKERKSAGAGYVPKGELWGKKTCLDEWLAFVGTQGEKSTLEEGAGTSGIVQERH